MRKISTGEDSNLRTWRRIAYALDGFKEGRATAFVNVKIAESPNGEEEEVIADEAQLLMALAKIANEEEENEDKKKIERLITRYLEDGFENIDVRLSSGIVIPIVQGNELRFDSEELCIFGDGYYSQIRYKHIKSIEI